MYYLWDHIHLFQYLFHFLKQHEKLSFGISICCRKMIFLIKKKKKKLFLFRDDFIRVKEVNQDSIVWGTESLKWHSALSKFLPQERKMIREGIQELIHSA